jgi:hypothetical protein
MFSYSLLCKLNYKHVLLATINHWIGTFLLISFKTKNKQLLKKYQEKTEVEKGKYITEPDLVIEFNTFEYSMNFTTFRKIKRNNWVDAFKSKTIRCYYLMLFAFAITLFSGLLIVGESVPIQPLKISAKTGMDSFQVKATQPQIIVNNIVINDSLINSDTIFKH